MPSDSASSDQPIVTSTRAMAANPHEAHLPETVRDALAKYDRGEKISEHQMMLVQWVRNGGGCASCGPVRRGLAKIAEN